VSLRPEPAGRVEAFCSGLRAVGFSVRKGLPSSANAGDVLVIWNRRGQDDAVAQKLEAAGGTVIVAENAYLGRGGYAVSRGKHHAGGGLLVQDPGRVSQLQAELAPWREEGGHVLVCPNRFIGPRTDVMPENWVASTTAQLKRLTKRPVKVRPHPGNWKRNPPKTPIEEDLRGAWACVIWWSTSGIHALLAGVPVIFCGPYWIARKAAGRNLKSIEAPLLGDRQAAIEDIANGQFKIEEIAAGVPFMGLACPST
jgi:hypothetical protein